MAVERLSAGMRLVYGLDDSYTIAIGCRAHDGADYLPDVGVVGSESVFTDSVEIIVFLCYWCVGELGIFDEIP